jgi:hypothetical protein
MWTPVEIFIIRSGKEMFAITDYDITFTLRSVYLVTDTAQIKVSFVLRQAVSIKQTRMIMRGGLMAP